MDVAVILRRLFHGQFQQREVLASRFGVVGMMVELHACGGNRADLPEAVGALEHFVHRVGPLPAVAAVDFFIPENDAFAAVGTEAPGVAITGLLGAWSPGGLQSGAPAGMKDLVQIGADADICIVRHQGQ